MSSIAVSIINRRISTETSELWNAWVIDELLIRTTKGRISTETGGMLGRCESHKAARGRRVLSRQGRTTFTKQTRGYCVH